MTSDAPRPGTAPAADRPFRFGTNLVSAGTRSEWVEKCRRAESLGYDVLLIPDHLGAPSPFPALVAAAEATERPRVGTFVLNAGFWNPVLLARDVATTDQLTGGRLEVGLGTGYVRAEFDAAGLDWEPAGGRVSRLERTVETLTKLLASDEQKPQPAQRPRPPLLIGGHGERMLRLAAEHADILGFAGLTQAPGATPGTLMMADAATFAERVRFATAATSRAGALERNVLVQAVVITGDRRAAAEEIRRQMAPHLPDGLLLSVDQLLEAPMLLLGTAEQIADQLRRHRAELGISYFVVLEPWMEALGPVIELLR